MEGTLCRKDEEKDIAAVPPLIEKPYQTGPNKHCIGEKDMYLSLTARLLPSTTPSKQTNNQLEPSGRWQARSHHHSTHAQSIPGDSNQPPHPLRHRPGNLTEKNALQHRLTLLFRPMPRLLELF